MISASILSAPLENLKKICDDLWSNGVKFLHLDVMDGHFTPQVTFGHPFIQAARRVFPGTLDIHLMVENPEKFIQLLNFDLGASIITFHIEASGNVPQILKKIKQMGVQAGLAVNPETPVEKILPYIENLDLVLIMTVNPGFGGQRLIEEALEKVKFLKKYKEQKKLNFIISADGGINADTIGKVKASGVELPVVGSFLWREENLEKALSYFSV